MKQPCGDGTSVPKAARGYDVWIESGTWYTERKVSRRTHGPHAYAVRGAYKNGVRDCSCGCFMLSASSGGPVNPFGACPDNPKPKCRPVTGEGGEK